MVAPADVVADGSHQLADAAEGSSPDTLVGDFLSRAWLSTVREITATAAPPLFLPNRWSAKRYHGVSVEKIEEALKAVEIQWTRFAASTTRESGPSFTIGEFAIMRESARASTVSE